MFDGIKNHFNEKRARKNQQQLDSDALDAAHEKKFKTLLELIDKGANCDTVGKVKVSGYDDYYTVKTTVAQSVMNSGNLLAIEELLKRKKIDPNMLRPDGTPLLAHAVMERDGTTASLLLRYGANADYQYQNLETILSRVEKNDSLKFLLPAIRQSIADHKGVPVIAADAEHTPAPTPLTTKTTLEIIVVKQAKP